MGKFKAAEVIEAIQGSKGVVSVAARKLHCSRTTIYRYINDMPTVKQALDEEREDLLDFVEGKLLEQIKEGNMTAIIFYLKTQGKSRGYIERQEVTGADGGPVTLRVVYEDDDA